MSYILDALRRADSERAAVPGLNAQPLAPGGDDDDEGEGSPAGRSGGRRIWPLVAGALVLGLLVWWWWPAAQAPAPTAQWPAGSELAAEPPRANPPPPIPGPAPVAARPVLPPIATGAELPPLPDSPPPRTAPTADSRADVARAAPGASHARAGSAPLQLDTLPAGTSGAPTAPANARARAGSPEAAASTQTPRIYALADLPEEVRRELPSLQVTGSVYSPDPASRMLILNGQLFHEQDDLGNGVKVEQIKARAAVLMFRGYRYQISF